MLRELFIKLTCWLLLNLVDCLGQEELAHGLIQWNETTSLPQNISKTLVVYTYHDDDPAYRTSLNYFVQNGTDKSNARDYVILVIGNNTKNFPTLPQHIRQIQYTRAACHSWKAIKWLFESPQYSGVYIDQYDQFMFVDSSFRGPFLPISMKHRRFWVDIFINRLNSMVKLVGSIVHCQPSNVKGQRTTIPHIELAAAAMDRQGLQIVLNNDKMDDCKENMYHENSHHIEATIAIFEAGYTIDTFMLRYQGVNWRNRNVWNCNGGLDPVLPNMYDGISVSPLEVMFIPVKQEHIKDIRYESARAAEMYSRWSNITYRNLHLADNEFDSVWMQSLIQDERMQLKHKKDCFDAEFYLQNSPDLRQHVSSIADVWSHFINSGFQEGRAYKFKCNLPSQTEVVMDPALVYNLRACWDSNYYLVNNKDLVKGLGGNVQEENLWNHFTWKGYKEGRQYRLICNSKGEQVHHKSWMAQYEECFDIKFYKSKNPGLESYKDDELWEHFVQIGYLENRGFHFDCDNPKKSNPTYLTNKLMTKSEKLELRAQIWRKWYEQIMK
eukprot:TRINITY_DN3522_c0_g1_i1.p1 TRINITY_DN3522_c0_g1~~TRINITY_DN3522_c0_g1_i1.p1  ORF type:complete len:553 (+),score=36.55 TRINITY_DN3522_c0_g1_i1:136-1794(+)